VNLAAWLHGTARNAAHWAARQEARRARREEEAAMVRRAQAPAPGGLPGRLDRELSALPAEQRQAVILRYLEGRTQEEAAAIAGCPQGTLVRRAMLGLERLRGRLYRRSPELGAALLLGLLQGEAEAAVPGTLLPSLVAASKLAATGAAAGVAGAKALAIAEGAMQAMFWMKVKIAAAVLVCAAVVGVGAALAYKAVAGDGPAAAAKAEGIKPEAVRGPRLTTPAAEAAGFGEPVRGLAVSLKITPGEWPEGKLGSVWMEVGLKNTTDRKMLIYRFLGRDADPGYLRIRDEAGRTWEYGRSEQVLLGGKPSPKEFLALAPGEEKVTRMKLKPDEFYLVVPPGAKSPSLKTDVGKPSLDERVAELPAGAYTLTYTHQSVIEQIDGKPTLDGFRAVAKELGYDDFWTGSVSSKPVQARVRPAQAAKPPAPEVF
jgi:hypothetical protein